MTSDGTYDYTYDARGNEQTKTNIATGDEWTYTYNNANEMVSAVETTSASVVEQTIDFKYDIFGNRVEVDVTPAGGPTTVTRYGYDMWNPAKAGALGTSGSDVWATFTSGGSLTMRELQGDGIDQHLAYTTSSNAYWYLTDHLSSIRSVLDSSGGVTASVAYDAYGNLTTAAAPGLYDWTGREFDVETGLQYNRARYYDPGTGRWISQDPMGFDAGDGNLYRYVKNRPTDAADPSGNLPASTPVGTFAKKGNLFILTVNVKFNFVDPTFSPGWTAAAKTKFQTDFITGVESIWNANPFTLASRDEKRYLPRLALVPVTTSGEDLVVNAKNWDDGAYYADGTRDLYLFKNTNTTTMAHEFGHFLGLYHPGAYLPKGKGETPGGEKIDLRAKLKAGIRKEGLPADQWAYQADPFSLMGSGTAMRGFYFERWIKALGGSPAVGALDLDEANPVAKRFWKNYSASVPDYLQLYLPPLHWGPRGYIAPGTYYHYGE